MSIEKTCTLFGCYLKAKVMATLSKYRTASLFHGLSANIVEYNVEVVFKFLVKDMRFVINHSVFHSQHSLHLQVEETLKLALYEMWCKLYLLHILCGARSYDFMPKVLQYLQGKESNTTTAPIYKHLLPLLFSARKFRVNGYG